MKVAIIYTTSVLKFGYFFQFSDSLEERLESFAKRRKIQSLFPTEAMNKEIGSSDDLTVQKEDNTDITKVSMAAEVNDVAVSGDS
jgi:hypothetical protein